MTSTIHVSTVSKSYSGIQQEPAPRTIATLGLEFWGRSLRDWLPEDLAIVHGTRGKERALRHLAQACGCPQQALSDFLGGQIFSTIPDLESGAFGAPAMDHFTLGLDRITLAPFRKALLTARSQRWTADGLRLLKDEQAPRLRAAIAFRHLVWSQVLRVLMITQSRRRVLDCPETYLAFMDRTLIMQNAVLDGVQTTQDLLSLLYTDAVRALAASLMKGSTGASLLNKRPQVLRSYAHGAEYLQSEYGERRAELARPDWPLLPAWQEPETTQNPSYTAVAGRLAAALACVMQPNTAMLRHSPPPPVATPGSEQAPTPLDSQGDAWMEGLFALLTEEERTTLGVTQGDLLGVATNRSGVPLGVPSLFIRLDPSSADGHTRAYFYRIPLSGSSPDWRQLLSEADLDDLGASREQVKIALPGVSPPPGATLLRKTAQWQGQAIRVTYYVHSH